MRALGDSELRSLVVLQQSHYRPEVLVIARAELARRRLPALSPSEYWAQCPSEWMDAVGFCYQCWTETTDESPGQTLMFHSFGPATPCPLRNTASGRRPAVHEMWVDPPDEVALHICTDRTARSVSRDSCLGTCPESLGMAALSGRLERAREPIRRALADERRRHEINARRQEINAKAWPERVKRAVLENRIEIGMTSDQVTSAWGRPESIDETITVASRQEQWMYPGPTYLSFTNGTLTTIHRRR